MGPMELSMLEPVTTPFQDLFDTHELVRLDPEHL